MDYDLAKARNMMDGNTRAARHWKEKHFDDLCITYCTNAKNHVVDDDEPLEFCIAVDDNDVTDCTTDDDLDGTVDVTRG